MLSNPIFWLIAIPVIFALLFIPLGKPPLRRAFQPSDLPDDLDEYLRTEEAKTKNIRRNQQKEIIWAHEDKRVTELAIVYLHVFTVSRREISPICENLAFTHGANLYFTRYKGHGIRGKRALRGVFLTQWLRDTEEALEIGRRIGKNVLIVSTSNGATLFSQTVLGHSIFPQNRPPPHDEIIGVVQISPNYRLNYKGSWLMNRPVARLIAPFVFRGFFANSKPESKAHARFWTLRYPVHSIYEMAAAVYATKRLDVRNMPMPSLHIYDRRDSVSDQIYAKHWLARWGSAKGVANESFEITNADCKSHHVIAGEIRSPNSTKTVETIIDNWLKTLESRRPNS